MKMKEDLLNTLEDLIEKEFEDFKWFLKDESLEGHQAIKASQLEKAERRDTVDLMVQTYQLPGAVEVTKKLLQKINRNDLLQSLSDSSSGPEEPEPQPISNYQKWLRENFQNKFMCAQEGLAKKKDEQCLDDIYTELYITAGGDIHINKQHEVLQIEMAGKATETEKSVEPSDMFKHPSGKYRPIRTVLTNGIAGIGKTFLVHKFVLDWAEGRTNQDVHLIFPFTFRQLNLLMGQKFCLAELIHKCIRETKDIKEDALNHIFTTLQSSGNTNYDKSKYKLLFVFDGLDESRLHLDCSTNEEQDEDFNVTETTSVDALLANLIKKNLLPCARLWITTRPTAANQIHSDFVDMATEVRGFTDQQKEEYFRKKFRDEQQATQDTIISHIKTSRSLHIMCHIPVFCWITATVLEDVLKNREGGGLPKTLTEMYTKFLMFQILRTEKKYGPEKCVKYIKSLAKLAFHQLEKGNLIFYEKDLRESGIDVSGAAVCSGVFTQIFKEERGNEDKMFSFVHLSIQEFLAAFYVEKSLIDRNKNVMSEPGQTCGEHVRMFFSKTSVRELHRFVIDKALQSPNGHLDLFLRFFLGLSLETNQNLLRGLLKKKRSSQTSHETVEYIKEKINENLSSERSINLFHCLNELNDRSLVEEIQQYLSSARLSTDKLSPSQWSALVFILLSSEKDLDVFDLKKYSASEEALLRLLPVVKASNKALLKCCNLSERSCDALSSVLSSRACSLIELDLSENRLQDSGVNLLSAGLENPHCTLEILRLSDCNLSKRSCDALSSVLSSRSSSLRELELSDNDLHDSGVKLLSAGLESPNCTLEILSLSGCLITEESCASLASALRSNPSHLRELDVSYNHPGASGVKLLKDPHCRLDTLRVDHCGEQRLKPGLRKYVCELTLDTNTAHKYLKLSDNNREVTAVTEEQPYPEHPERFDVYYQLLCRDGLTGRCYWEVEWSGLVYISVSYRGIRRKGDSNDCLFGGNNLSWSLRCSDDDGYSIWHNNRKKDLPSTSSSSSSSSSVSNRVAVYVDCPAGTLFFYRVSSDTLIHLHTFNITFTEPLYAGFWILSGSSMSLCSL
ncbi:NACHT, LRR and PYD domains-containing protein 3-like [Thunnus thynnus]|uniref:NACHT, LRR and PYD domains-containing protein 3-like n=1 Tax=Thunnus thynnus TaxID=8237 RepID=UPI0035272C0E